MSLGGTKNTNFHNSMGALSNPISFAIRISKQFFFSFLLFVLKSGLRILIRALEVPFLGPQNAKNGSNKNSSETLGAREMGLDRAPIEF